MNLPRAGTYRFRRLPGWKRASLVWDILMRIEQRERFQLADNDLARRVRAKWDALTRADRAVVAALMAADPSLPRHVARWEKSIRGRGRAGGAPC